MGWTPEPNNEFEPGTRVRFLGNGGVYTVRGDDDDVPPNRLYWLVPEGVPRVREHADGGIWTTRREFTLIYDVPDLTDQEEVEAWLGS